MKQISKSSVLYVLGICTVLAGISISINAEDQIAAPDTKKELTAVATPQPSATLANLMTAYNGESNAKAKYLAYAKKADEEGYKKAAQLFRAAARSEEIHAGLHSKAIVELGGMPKAEVKLPEIKTTKENLEDALKGESYESDAMYPKFLEQAKADNVKMAAISFGSAMGVEKNHKMMFEQSLKNLKAWKKASKGFYVCTVCGNLTDNLNFAECAICHAPVSKFEQVK
ncbi:MAG: rubrerythrin [Elusimicrobia bacterium]|nr:rubrerythrin [Candidatus Liberimonas magnetica]